LTTRLQRASNGATLQRCNAATRQQSSGLQISGQIVMVNGI